MVETNVLDLPCVDTVPEPLKRLEARLCELAGHLTAATCQFLLLVADFDQRQGWADWQLPSCAAWLSWKCQIAPGTAREQVRVARSMVEYPVIRREFAAGRLSYAKVRALTRIVTPETETDLVDMATPMTASQLERFAQAHRRVSEADRERPRPARRLGWSPAGDLDYKFGAILPSADAAVIFQALRAAREDLEHPHDDHDHEHGDGVRAVAGADPEPHPADVSAETPPFWHPAHPDRCHPDDGPAISPATLAPHPQGPAFPAPRPARA